LTPVDPKPPAASNYRLHQNYPNPFNPSTTIRFELPKTGYATMRVYNALGQEVATLLDAVEDAGTQSVQWDAVRCASGMYFCVLTSGTFSATTRMTLLK
jgi:hypothetical protein